MEYNNNESVTWYVRTSSYFISGIISKVKKVDRNEKVYTILP